MNRRIDETPSRTELLQYEKRFMELYEQIQAKHEETKRFYSQYNTTTDNQGFVNKEISLLNSIQVRGWIYMHVNREGLRTHTYAPPMDCLAVQKQFTNCLQNAASREEFKKSLETIAGSVTATLEKQQGKLNAEVRLVPSLSLPPTSSIRDGYACAFFPHPVLADEGTGEPRAKVLGSPRTPETILYARPRIPGRMRPRRKAQKPIGRTSGRMIIESGAELDGFFHSSFLSAFH